MDERQCNSRIAALEERVKASNKRIDSLEERTEDVPKILVLLEQQIETNKAQNKQFKEITDTLNIISKNLTELHVGQKELTKDNRDLGERIGKIETDIHESKESSTIDINRLLKRVVFVAIPSIVALALGVWLGLR